MSRAPVSAQGILDHALQTDSYQENLIPTQCAANSYKGKIVVRGCGFDGVRAGIELQKEQSIDVALVSEWDYR